MSRSIRFETRSRARDELRRAMTSIDKVKRWEKQWVSVGTTNTCKLKVYKWVPKAMTEEEQEAEKKAENNAAKIAEKKPEKPAFPSTTQFLQNGDTVNPVNEDSRDSFTNSSDKMEFMKYCPDPDSQDSITESENTVSMSDQLEDSTKPSSKCSTPPSEAAPATNPKITVADAFKDKLEPKLPTPDDKDEKPKEEEAAKEPAAVEADVKETVEAAETAAPENTDKEEEEEESSTPPEEDKQEEEKGEEKEMEVEEPLEEEKKEEEEGPPTKKLKETESVEEEKKT